MDILTPTTRVPSALVTATQARWSPRFGTDPEIRLQVAPTPTTGVPKGLRAAARRKAALDRAAAVSEEQNCSGAWKGESEGGGDQRRGIDH